MLVVILLVDVNILHGLWCFMPTHSTLKNIIQQHIIKPDHLMPAHSAPKNVIQRGISSIMSQPLSSKLDSVWLILLMNIGPALSCGAYFA